MRVTTGFNRMLCLPGASVIDVCFGSEGVIVTVRLRRPRRVCSRCGQLGGTIHDRRVKRWRHLDLGTNRCVIERELRRLWSRDCGAQLEAVPWAPAGSSYTRDFEGAWLAQQMAKTIAGLLRIAWGSVGNSARSSHASSPITSMTPPSLPHDRRGIQERAPCFALSTGHGLRLQFAESTRHGKHSMLAGAPVSKQTRRKQSRLVPSDSLLLTNAVRHAEELGSDTRLVADAGVNA